MHASFDISIPSRTYVWANQAWRFSDANEDVYHETTRTPLSQILASPPISVQPRPIYPRASYRQIHVPTTYESDYSAPYPTQYSPDTFPGDHTYSGDLLSRGTSLIRQANDANPFRVRTEEERPRSRSPPYMPPVPGLLDPYAGLVPLHGNFRGSITPSPNRSVQPLISPESLERGRPLIRNEEHRVDLPQITESPLDLDEHKHTQDAQKSPLASRHIERAQERAGQAQKEENGLQCEFADPCRMEASPDGLHFRKVVSHVFGRNKAVTKIFPAKVWVHYCRKHYQRARYRADQWPFTQCDLLMESLHRMEEWNGVADFELTLRRREKIRVAEVADGKLAKKEATAKDKQAPRSTRPGRKHPTAIIAPTPDWLRQCAGDHLSFAEIRAIIERIRQYMNALRKREKEQQAEQIDQFKKATTNDEGQSTLVVRTHSKRHQAKSHPYKPRPAPSMVRFPDIEILPNFRPWVREAALRQRSATAPPVEKGANAKKASGRAGASKAEATQLGEYPGGSIQGRGHTILPLRPRNPSLTGNVGHSEIGRVGTNRGSSTSQQTRSRRVYEQALDRTPRRRPVKESDRLDHKIGLVRRQPTCGEK